MPPLTYAVNLQTSASFGGGGGGSFDDVQSLNQQIVGIRALRIRHSHVLEWIEPTYLLENGSTVLGERHGVNNNGEEYYFEFADDEVITEVQGVSGRFMYSLTFITTDGTNITRRYSMHGSTFTSFSVQEQVIGFYGRSGGLIDALGFYHDGEFCMLHDCMNKINSTHSKSSSRT